MSKNRDALIKYSHQDNEGHILRTLLRWLSDKVIGEFLADEFPFLLEEIEA